MKNYIRTTLVIVSILFSSYVLSVEKIVVFAAASLTNAMQDIGQSYHSIHPNTDVVFSFASSSVLARQIEQGAPADIFMSADQKWMDYLQQQDLVFNRETLLRNSLVLVAPIDSKLQHVDINKNTDWKILLPSNEKIAVGDPDHVPAGIYAKDSLTNLGVYNKLEKQFARASNVRDALIFVERGEAVLGIVYSTDAKISPKVKTVGEFPAESYATVEYPITLLDQKNKPAKAFYKFLKSTTAKQIFAQYGFVTQ